MKTKTIFISLLVMLLWGFLFPTVKLGYQVFGISSVGDILTFAGLRFFLCGIVISAYAFFRAPKSFVPLRQHIWPVLCVGIFAIILHYTCTYLGLTMTEGSKTAILKQLGAVFYVCFAPLFFPEDKVTAKKMIGLVLGICGIVAINLTGESLRFGWGDLLIIGASFCTVFSNVISKKTFRAVEPIVSTGISQLFGGAVLLTVGLCAGGEVTALVPTTPTQGLVFGGILLASIFSYCLWFSTLKKENLSKLFIIKFAEPLFASLFGWIILGEDIFNLRYLSAFVLISLGVWVANQSNGIKEKS